MKESMTHWCTCIAQVPGMATSSRCCALVLCLQGSEGHLLLRECIQSFVHFEGIESIYIADLAETRRHLMGVVDIPASIVWLHYPNAPLDTALNAMASRARDNGFTHVMHLRSHEVIKHAITGDLLEGLPKNWQALDAIQIAATTKFRTICDIVVRLSAFPVFVGPMLPAPFPSEALCTQTDLVVRPWLDACLSADTYDISETRGLEIISNIHWALTKEDESLTPSQRGFVMHQLAQAYMQVENYTEARNVLDALLQSNTTWADADGKYILMLWKCKAMYHAKIPLETMLPLLLETATLGLNLRRTEGLIFFYVCALQSNARHWTGPLLMCLQAMTSCPWFHGKVHAVWNGPADSFYIMHELIACGTLSHPHMVAAIEHPHYRLLNRMQRNYNLLQLEGDDAPLFAYLPSATTMFLPAIIVHRNYISNVPAFLAACTKIAMPSSHLPPFAKWNILIQNALGVHFGCQFVSVFGKKAPMLLPLPGQEQFPIHFPASPASGYHIIACLSGCLRVKVLARILDREDVLELQSGDLICVRAGPDVLIQAKTSHPYLCLFAHVAFAHDL